MIDDHSEGLLTEEQAHHGTGKGFTKGGRLVTIDMLPDVALLEIFDFYLVHARIDAWHELVHVCRKWRNVVFGSPCRLDLRIHCNYNTPAREVLDVWPLLPIVVWDNKPGTSVDNVIAALEHNDRIREISLEHWQGPISRMAKVLAAMIRPFPTLTSLVLQHLCEIPFPGLPNLLPSATHLVHIKLLRIPHSGYISPKAMVTALSVLTRLEALHIGFESPRSHPDWKNRRPPPPTRTLLPVLAELWFQGVSEYLEDFVARVDSPLLEKLTITFFQQLIFDTPELTQFISRAPKFKTIDATPRGALMLGILCRGSDWQLSSLTQVCSLSFPRALIPAVERLYITQSRPFPPPWQKDIESSQWLELMHPFTAVKDFYMSREFTLHISPALQELVGERVTEVLPALENLFLESLPSGSQEAIGQFVAARRLASEPIAVSPWERE